MFLMSLTQSQPQLKVVLLRLTGNYQVQMGPQLQITKYTFKKVDQAHILLKALIAMVPLLSL